MSEDLGSAHGSVTINAASALATLATLRRKSAATVGTLNTVGRAAITAGTGVGAIGAGIAGLFALAVNKSAELEKRISYIKGITGIHGKEVDVVRNKIIQLGQDSAYTANEVADGFTELSKAGATTQQLVGGVGDAMITMGQSADIPLDEAAKSLISISSTFKLLPKQAGHIADILQGAANASIIGVDDMAVSFKYAGAIAANLGISMEDTATAIAELGNAGIRGSTAGTSLRRMLLQLTPRTLAARTAMEELGIVTEDGRNKFYDAEGNAKSLSKVTEILHKSTKGLTAEMRQKQLATIFGDRAVNSAIVLARGGAKAFDNMYKKVGNVKAADVAAERLNNLAGKWEILKGSIDSALIKAGAPAQKPLMQIVALVTRLVNAFTNLSPKTQEMIVRFALITAGILLLVGGFLIIIGTMFRAAAVIIQLVNVLKIITMQVKLFMAVMRAANGALLFSWPVLLVVALIALAIGLIYAYKHSEKFRNIVNKVAGVIKNAAKAVWGFIKAIPDAVANAWQATVKWLKNLWNGVKNFVGDVVNFLKSNWYVIVLAMLLGPFGLFVGLFIKFRKQIFNAVKIAIDAVINFLAKLPGRIGFILGFVIGRAIRFTIMFYRTMYQAGQKAVNALYSFLGKLPGRVWNFLKAAWRFLVKWVPIVLAKARAGGAAILHGVINFVKNLPARLWHWLKTAWLKLGQFERDALSKARDIGIKVKDAMMEGIKKIPGLIRGALSRAIQVFKNMIKGAWKASRDFAGGLWKGFKKGLFGSPRTKIEYAMEDMGQVVNDETKNLASQIRLLQKYSRRLPAYDGSMMGPAFSARSVGMREGGAGATSSGARTMTVNINNPSRQTVTQSYDRGLRQTAYARGWSR